MKSLIFDNFFLLKFQFKKFSKIRLLKKKNIKNIFDSKNYIYLYLKQILNILKNYKSEIFINLICGLQQSFLFEENNFYNNDFLNFRKRFFFFLKTEILLYKIFFLNNFNIVQNYSELCLKFNKNPNTKFIHNYIWKFYIRTIKNYIKDSNLLILCILCKKKRSLEKIILYSYFIFRQSPSIKTNFKKTFEIMKFDYFLIFHRILKNSINFTKRFVIYLEKLKFFSFFYHEIFFCKSYFRNSFGHSRIICIEFMKKSNFVSYSDLLLINGVIYIKICLIAKGGSGKVYKIIDQNKKIFALKKIKINQNNKNFCLKEISILKAMNKRKGIIHIIDVEFNLFNSKISIILEFGKENLHELLRNPLNRNINSKKLLCLQIADAVNLLHSEKIVHSDLKPSNFMFIKKSLKIIDFGISHEIYVNRSNISREIQIGSINYISPEAIIENSFFTGKKKYKIGKFSDVWSIGCIFYEIFYGNPPFYEYTFLKKIQIITDKLDHLIFPKNSDSLLNDLIKFCLRKDPNLRILINEILKHPFFDVF
ncbi:putative protein kinase (nucleomorph) [Guillardia theta]|uniref:Protein kinase domain-containing protein n=2 Tax=Guillardia theta TaxID=55529 RepID=Q98S30_GUITH|nr:putative protein kinase [Guillardia theta]AAK39750.1 putative protein kinase [Guillardia theta]